MKTSFAGVGRVSCNIFSCIIRICICFLMFAVLFSRHATAQTTWELDSPSLPNEPTGDIFYAHTDGGIDNDSCSKNLDQAKAITDWIASIPDNSTIIFEEGCYLINAHHYAARVSGGSIEINDKNTLKIEGVSKERIDAQGNTILNTNGYPELEITTVFKVTEHVPLTGCNVGTGQYSGRRHIFVKGGSNIILRNLKVEGFNITPDQREGFGAYISCREFEHGFAVHEVDKVLLENLHSYGTFGDGVYIGNSNPGATNVTGRNIRVEYNGRQGVGIAHAEKILLENVEIMNTRRAGFDLEPNGAYVRDIEIRNSYIQGYHVAFASGGAGEVSNVYLHHNKIGGTGMPWVYNSASNGQQRYNWKVEANTVLSGLGSPTYALRFSNVDNVEVINNVSPVALSQGRRAVQLSDVGGSIQIIRNDFGGACWAYETAGVTNEVVAYDNHGYTCDETYCNGTKYPRCFPLGDLNGDTTVNIVDVTRGLHYIFNKTTRIPLQADINGDSLVLDILDIQNLVSRVFI